MKTLLLVIIITVNSMFGQENKYSFDYRENRTPTGWEKVETSGDVIFHETRYTNTITIITSDKFQMFYVKSKQLFIKQEVYLITLVDEQWQESSIRLVINKTLDTLDLYFYSDRIEDKYYRLKLKRCN
jgi:hypothetical protein